MRERRLTRRRFLGAAGAVAATAGVVRILGDRPATDDVVPATTSTPAPSTSQTTVPAATSAASSPASSEPLVRARQVICREAWGAAPIGDGAVEHQPVRLSLHHTALVLDSPRDAPDRAVEHQRSHQARGWADLAYHFLVDPAGHVYAGRPVEHRGDTATGYDPTGHLLVCCEGNYEVQEPTAAQLGAVADVLAWGAATFGIGSDTLAGHRDVAATACPGENLQRRIPELRTMIDERLAAGGVVLDEACGDAGDAIVTAIRAGR